MFGFSDEMNDMVNAFFGGHMGFQHESQSRKARKITRALPVTLADLYRGKTIEVPRTRTIMCPACEGRGMKSKRNSVCQSCRGSGNRLMMRQMGMMVQQVRATCDVCGGKGNRIDPRDVCTACQGKRTTEVDSPLNVVVERGMHHGEELVFRGEGDCHPSTDMPGDIVIVLEQVKDERFMRDGDDLHITRTISLAESLCGFQFVLTHLDGRELVVRRERGEITKPGEVKIVVGEGMPVHRRPNQCGDLVIKFHVHFPTRMEQSQVDLLRAALPPPKSLDVQHCEYAQECYVSREELDELRRELDEEVKEDDENLSVGCAAQ